MSLSGFIIVVKKIKTLKTKPWQKTNEHENIHNFLMLPKWELSPRFQVFQSTRWQWKSTLEQWQFTALYSFSRGVLEDLNTFSLKASEVWALN
jgi:hypothetical protein